MGDYRLTAECFVIPNGSRYLVYFPLREVVYETDADGARLIDLLREGIADPLGPAIRETVAFLVELGAVNGEPEILHDAELDSPFAPTDVTLFLTHDCNLRCGYCYSRGGEQPATLPWEVAEAACRLVLDNAQETEAESAEIVFHGGGEPTVAFAMLQRVVEQVRQEAKERRLEPRFSLATNGVVPPARWTWILDHIPDITISCDGLPAVQNKQRPRRDGSGSYRALERSLVALHQRKRDYGIRATVTHETADQMAEMVTYYGERFGASSFHFEPAHLCTAGRRQGSTSCDSTQFIRGYRAAREVAHATGLGIYYSGARLDQLTSRFCGTASQAFTVTPLGQATACYEVSRPEDPRAEVFFFGQYDKILKTFQFDAERLRSLSALTVEAWPHCRDCFCKWHCAGDCPAKRELSETFDGTDRCVINMELTRDQLIRRLRDEGGKE